MLPVAKGLNSNDENDIQYLYRHESDFTNGGIMQRHEERALELVRRLLMKIRAPLRQSLIMEILLQSCIYDLLFIHIA